MIAHCIAFIATVGVLAPALLTAAQPMGTARRVGILSPGSAAESPAIQRDPFERGLRELGWMPGSSIIVEYRYAEGSDTRLMELAAELVRLGVDVIVARGAGAIRAAQQTTATIPIVMSSAADPVANGFVRSLAQPEGNITGIASLLWELDGKRLELLKEAIPRLARVAVLANPTMEAGRYQQLLAPLRASARSLGLELELFEIKRAEQIPGAFVAMGKAGVGALLVWADQRVLEPNRAQVVMLAAKHRLPAMFPWHFYTDIDGLMSYATSVPGFHHRSATYVDRILKGAKPGELPVEQPTKFELVINLKTAKALNLTIPQSLLLRADRVIQ